MSTELSSRHFQSQPPSRGTTTPLFFDNQFTLLILAVYRVRNTIVLELPKGKMKVVVYNTEKFTIIFLDDI